MRFFILPFLFILPFWGFSQTEITWTPTIIETYVLATTEAVTLGDGAGVDEYYRNSGIVVKDGSFFAVNGVHPVNQGNYTSYYPKSLIKAGLDSDAIETRCPYYGVSNSNASEIDGTTITHEVDMEALTFGPDEGETYIYVGDEYNYVYQIEIATCDITKQWNIGDLGINTDPDQGIEAIAYNSSTGNFFVGVQGNSTIYEVAMSGFDDCTTTNDCPVTLVNSFSSVNSPSGMFYSASDDRLIVFAGTSTNGDQFIYVYTTAGDLDYEITIPASFGISRGDGIFIEGSTAYIVDSQGPIWVDSGSLGVNLLEVEWPGLSGLVSTDDVFENSLTISPNPTTGLVNVEGAPIGSRVEIFDVRGAKIMGADQLQNIDVSQLENGVYMMHILDKDGEKSAMKKLLKI